MDINLNQLIETMNHSKKEPTIRKQTFKQIFTVNKIIKQCTKFKKTNCNCGCTKNHSI